ncbi:sugar phosphate isomerase/epimerase family protein [Paenibacillus thalictri]|uniref:Sugar phosphate isomerase/epimerase n=1 Tax=Paenibacillus thalictri TaxID=2527873 RepID=A0A4Q9DVT1_9BACL|nr:sugar phosphate isomerase/epimerase family protein [Paenibacillus thalictri]TBL81167.1 sugar phosphate isomerase/epimerase [Paenibacillus thalictri]
MRLSTSTNFFSHRLNGEDTPYIEAVRRCKEAGFLVQDVNFCPALDGRTELAKDNWQALIEDVRNEAEKLGVEFTQSHPVFISGHPSNQPAEKLEYYREMMRRSIIASSILGVKWAVLHPTEERTSTVFDTEASVKANMEFHGFAVELAMKHNVGIAFENMIEGPKSKRRFSSNAAELVALIDAFKDPGVGACWDFGHGNFLYKDQRIALRTLGHHLKATHMNDNCGTADDHLFPFHGTVDWHSVLPVLSEIGYSGDLTYEAHNEFSKLPEHLKDPVAKAGYEIGMYCLSLANH